MSTGKDVRWGRWIGVIAGAIVFLKSAGFLVARLVGLVKSEMQARGDDVAFVLGLAERRRSGR